jgi:8-oxo-dGTP diphosphatase
MINQEQAKYVQRKGILSNYISVDCVIFGFDFNRLNVLLVDRVMNNDLTGEELFSDLTLTGNHIFEDEDLDDAASRILFDLTGLKNIYLEQFYTFGSPNRFPRDRDKAWLAANGRDPYQRIISVGYYSLLATDRVTLEWKGRNVRWVPVDDISDLAFDHLTILQSALAALRKKLIYEPIGFELLPPKFTLSQLQRLYEVILGVSLDKRNFRKKIARMKYLIPLEEKQKGVAHKPARLYIFDREIFENSRQEILDFAI